MSPKLIIIWDIKLYTAKLEEQIGHKFYLQPYWFKLVVYSGKFKLFDPRYAQVKKFEFALVNHSFEPIRSDIRFSTYFVPLIWP